MQGNLADSNLGRVSAAFESYRKSEAILSRLAAVAPGDAALEVDHVRVSRRLVTMYAGQGQFAAATSLTRRHLALAEASAAAHPDNPGALASLAAAKSTLADLLADQRDYAGAIVLREQVLVLTGRAAKGRTGPDHDVALAHKRLGALYGVTGRFPEARREYEQARVLDEARAAADPTDPRPKLDLSFDYSDLGWVDARTGNLAGALASHHRALALRQEVAAADPSNYRAASTVASSEGRIAGVLFEKRDFPAAIAAQERAIALYAGLAAKPGAESRAATLLAGAYADLGAMYAGVPHPRWAEAAGAYEKARGVYLAQQQKGALPADQVKRLGEIEREIERCRAHPAR